PVGHVSASGGRRDRASLRQLPDGRHCRPIADALSAVPGLQHGRRVGEPGDIQLQRPAASLQRRFHNGLNLMAAYTWSKTLTDADSALPFFASLHGGGSAQNPFDLKGERSLSNQDVPQTLVLSYIYELPIGKGKKLLPQGGVLDRIVGGWEFSGIHRY